ncbi:glycosyltransferase family 4 protein [Patescibacteria group bacterium]|nr:glycosyltransferase family 4 protein [Patescibacteria group bacterium]
MRIGVEASRANRLHRTGVEWYAYHLMRELAHLPEAARHEWLAYTESPLQPDLREVIPHWHEKILPWFPKYLWTQVRLSLEMYQHPPDVLFIPAHVLPRVLPKKTVVTIHDVGFHRFPHLYKPIQVAYHEITTRDIVRSNARIITVSEFCKQEIMDIYKASSEQITVTPLGIDHARYRPQTEVEKTRVREKYQLNKPFLFFVGRLEEKKNIARVVEAFCAAASSLPNEAELVLAGPAGKGWNQVSRWLETHPMRSRVRVLGYLSEMDKPGLTAAAHGYIQASLYEGFGLPVLEAMACETPVLCSRVASLPEIVGSARAIFFDPISVEEISLAMQKLFALSTSEREQMRHLGVEHVHEYTWQRTAQATLPVLVS